MKYFFYSLRCNINFDYPILFIIFVCYFSLSFHVTFVHYIYFFLHSSHLNAAFLSFASLRFRPTHFKCCHWLHFMHRIWPVELDLLLHLLHVFLSTFFFKGSFLVHFTVCCALFSWGSSSIVFTVNGKPGGVRGNTHL